METVTKIAVNPDTDQHEFVEIPEPEPFRQAVLELEYLGDGISVKDASIILAEKFELSDEQNSKE